jgi:hypothetical protein
VARPDDLIMQAPIRDSRPELRWRTLLEGTWYRFRLVYLSRSLGWWLDILEDGGAAIVEGIRVTEGTDLLAPFHALAVPPGQLFAGDTDGQGRPPDRHSWQSYARLYYRTTDVVAAAAGTADEVP